MSIKSVYRIRYVQIYSNFYKNDIEISCKNLQNVLIYMSTRPSGEIGRRNGLKIRR